jgi:type II secretory ATPase GspE/PulE/Tfp pilus assembly ATPase PilB-like protein
MPMVRIGEALIALGHITPAQLDEALAQQRQQRGVPLGELLLRNGTVSRENLQAALARKMGYPLVDVTQFAVDAAALARIPFPMARRLQALPLLLRDGRLVVALEDPGRGEAIDEIEFLAQRKVMPVLARPRDLKSAIERAYERIGAEGAAAEFDFQPQPSQEAEGINASELLATLEQQHNADERTADDDKVVEQSDNSLVRLINSMIQEARAQGVSDIHIECQPGHDKVRIRFRRDGLLKPYLELPHTYRNAIIARIKIMCDLDISERRKPQDGKINFARFSPGTKLELRVATIPTNGGQEDVVMRLLASAKPLPLEQLNLRPQNLERLKAAVARPYGMFLCVGPTGSGKTTTLHSAMGYINTPERKIWTAEDPIEITQAGLRQVQMNPKIGWTFAGALRAFLRADPDVIMVGEIRDKETAQIAVEASLTGHLVLSTLHTNSAPETVTRLLDMGMDPFNFADALLAVLAQRLVRRLCKQCVTTVEASADQTEELLAMYMRSFGEAEHAPAKDEVLAGWMERFGRDGKLVHHHAPGCDHCDGSGFRGRAGIHELMSGSRALRQLIQTGARAEQIQHAALGEGMRTLRQDGIEKVLAGVTSIEEVRAVSNDQTSPSNSQTSTFSPAATGPRSCGSTISALASLMLRRMPAPWAPVLRTSQRPSAARETMARWYSVRPGRLRIAATLRALRRGGGAAVAPASCSRPSRTKT